MGYTNSTPFLGLPIWGEDDYMENEDWNTAWQNVEKAVRSISYLMDTYTYSWTLNTSEDTGATTIAVTLGEDCPRAATMTAVITPSEAGGASIAVTTTIDGETLKAEHTITADGGEGGNDNG